MTVHPTLTVQTLLDWIHAKRGRPNSLQFANGYLELGYRKSGNSYYSNFGMTPDVFRAPISFSETIYLPDIYFSGFEFFLRDQVEKDRPIKFITSQKGKEVFVKAVVRLSSFYWSHPKTTFQPAAFKPKCSFLIDKARLFDMLLRVKPFLGKVETTWAANHFFLQAAPKKPDGIPLDGVRLGATNGKILFLTPVPKVLPKKMEKGKFILEGAFPDTVLAFAEVFRALPGNKVLVAFTADGGRISCGDYSFSFGGWGKIPAYPDAFPKEEPYLTARTETPDEAALKQVTKIMKTFGKGKSKERVTTDNPSITFLFTDKGVKTYARQLKEGKEKIVALPPPLKFEHLKVGRVPFVVSVDWAYLLPIIQGRALRWKMFSPPVKKSVTIPLDPKKPDQPRTRELTTFNFDEFKGQQIRTTARPIWLTAVKGKEEMLLMPLAIR